MNEITGQTKLTITLSIDTINFVLGVLESAPLPFKQSQPVIVDLQKQANEQVQLLQSKKVE